MHLSLGDIDYFHPRYIAKHIAIFDSIAIIFFLALEPTTTGMRSIPNT